MIHKEFATDLKNSRSLILLFLLVFINVISHAKSPHGSTFKMNCAVCHTADSWKIEKDVDLFDHSKTKFPLQGQHKTVGCKKCHTTLEFSKAKKECFECHKDIHQGTVGNDCERCHTPSTWIVNKIKPLHQQAGFPLVGAHATADCQRCHTSASQLRFDNIRTDCYACHSKNYNATTIPNHQAVGFGTDCERCHTMAGYSWEGKGFEHGFFPLKGGHSNLDCFKCHSSANYKGESPECVRCHYQDYINTTNPAHKVSNFSTECNECHTINSWSPAKYSNHDSKHFPIYSGKHKGQWSDCTECHTNPSSYASFTCTNCHEHLQASMDSKHKGVNGYVWNSVNCYSCHPQGKH